MMIKKFYIVLKTFLLFSLLLTVACGKAEKRLAYKNISIEDEQTDFTSVEIPYIITLGKLNKNIFVYSKGGIWLVNLKTKTEKLFIRDGIGPEEVYKPLRIKRRQNDIYINSNLQLNYLYVIFNKAGEFKLERRYFEKNLQFDDFDFITDNLIAVANAYWENGFIRIYDLKSKEIDEIGTGKITEIMLKFNVDSASVCALGEKIYVAHKTIPEIMVISVKERKAKGKFNLKPPFYIPIPKKYAVEKYDQKSHREWMSSWTSINRILGKGDWLLIIYRRGYETRFCYELINLKNEEKRYYIEETGGQIYDFEVENDRMIFDAVFQDGEKVLFKHCQASIKDT